MFILITESKKGIKTVSARSLFEEQLKEKGEYLLNSNRINYFEIQKEELSKNKLGIGYKTF